jgi:hypothetical protein
MKEMKTVARAEETRAEEHEGEMHREREREKQSRVSMLVTANLARGYFFKVASHRRVDSRFEVSLDRRAER